MIFPQEWFLKRSFYEPQKWTSGSTEVCDEGYDPGSSLDASQDGTDLITSIIDETETDDDIVCMTPKEYRRDRSSCPSLNFVDCKVPYNRKRFTASDGQLLVS